MTKQVTVVQEERQFRIHPAVIYDVILRQAGTLAKGVLEGVMNAVDAGASTIIITVEPGKVTLVDDGKGFRSRADITTFFEVFGQPHVEGDATFGKFRMGRGQLFAFGGNRWRTGNWSMDVDIKNRGLDYSLNDEPETAKGCSIEINLYERLLPTDMLQLQRDLEKWCKYAPLKATLNGKVISTDPKTQKWDKDTPEAYIRIKSTGSLSVYNLGIHVMEIPAYKFGVGGEVVSKSQLKVNFARNDVQSDCPVWRKVKGVVEVMAGKKVEKSPTMTDEARQHIADKIASGALRGEAAMTAKVITAVNGRHYTPQTLTQWEFVTAAKRGDRAAEKAMDHKGAFVIATETFDRLGVGTAQELLDLVKQAAGGQYQYWRWPKVMSYEDATRAFQGAHEILDQNKLSSNQRAWLALARRVVGTIRYRPLGPGEEYKGGIDRDLYVGHSESAAAWTDGKTYAALNDDFLDNLSWDAAGFTKLGQILVHEFSHDGEDTGGCSHDQAFYEEFYERERACLPSFVLSCIHNAPSVLEAEGRKLNKKIAEAAAKQILVKEAAEKVVKVQEKAGQQPGIVAAPPVAMAIPEPVVVKVPEAPVKEPKAPKAAKVPVAPPEPPVAGPPAVVVPPKAVKGLRKAKQAKGRAVPPPVVVPPVAPPVVVPVVNGKTICTGLGCNKLVRVTAKGLYPHNKAPGVPCEAAPRGGEAPATVEAPKIEEGRMQCPGCPKVVIQKADGSPYPHNSPFGKPCQAAPRGAGKA